MINSIRSSGSAVLIFTEAMEVELALSLESYMESNRNFRKEEYLEMQGTTLKRLIKYAGFSIFSESINMKDNIEYKLELDEFWSDRTEEIIRLLVSVGMSIHAGFESYEGSMSWFFSSDLGSRRIKVDEYSL